MDLVRSDPHNRTVLLVHLHDLPQKAARVRPHVKVGLVPVRESSEFRARDVRDRVEVDAVTCQCGKIDKGGQDAPYERCHGADEFTKRASRKCLRDMELSI